HGDQQEPEVVLHGAELLVGYRPVDELHPALLLERDALREPLAECGAHRQCHPAALLEEEVEQLVDHLLHDRRKVALARHHRAHAREDLVVPARQHRLVEARLRAEMVLDRERAHAAGARQLAHRDAAVAAAGEQDLRAVEDPRARALGLRLRAPARGACGRIPIAFLIGHVYSKTPRAFRVNAHGFEPRSNPQSGDRMRALVIGNDMPRLAATRLLGAITPRAFVGPFAPVQLREIPAPVLPAPDWAVARTLLCGLCGSDYKQVFMN